MDLLAVLRIAARRWYILLPLIVLSVVGSFTVYQQVQPSYEIDGVLPITAPYVRSAEVADQLGRSSFADLSITSSIMASLADSSDTRQIVERQGGDPNYEITASSGAINVAVSTESPERALRTYNLLGAALGERLDTLQASVGIPPEIRVTISTALQPQGTLTSTSGRKRALLASLALGLSLSVATCVFVDYLLSRRGAQSVPGRAGRTAADASNGEQVANNHGPESSAARDTDTVASSNSPVYPRESGLRHLVPKNPEGQGPVKRRLRG